MVELVRYTRERARQNITNGDEDLIFFFFVCAFCLNVHMAIAHMGLAPLLPFDPFTDPSSVGQRWTSWLRRFKTYLLGLTLPFFADSRDKFERRSRTHKKTPLNSSCIV